jgi:hypothetical protein
MSTKNSPIEQLRTEADKIATALKRAERGKMNHIPKIAEARKRDNFVVGIVMNDKVLKPSIPWATIKALSHEELRDWIVNQMREVPCANLT